MEVCYIVSYSVYLCYPLLYFACLYLVREKGERGLPGPPGHCDCDSTLTNNAPFGSFTRRGASEKVPAVRPRSYNNQQNWIYSMLIVKHFNSLIVLLSAVCVCVDIYSKQWGRNGPCTSAQCNGVQKGSEGALLQRQRWMEPHTGNSLRWVLKYLSFILTKCIWNFSELKTFHHGLKSHNIPIMAKTMQNRSPFLLARAAAG